MGGQRQAASVAAGLRSSGGCAEAGFGDGFRLWMATDKDRSSLSLAAVVPACITVLLRGGCVLRSGMVEVSLVSHRSEDADHRRC